MECWSSTHKDLGSVLWTITPPKNCYSRTNKLLDDISHRPAWWKCSQVLQIWNTHTETSQQNACVDVCLHGCTYVVRGKLWVSSSVTAYPVFCDRVSYQTQNSTIQLGLLVREPQNPPMSTSQSWDYVCAPLCPSLCPSFYLEFWSLSLRLHTCSANTFPTKPCP